MGIDPVQLIAAVASVAAAVIAWLVYRNQVEATQPIVSVVTRPTDIPGWWRMTLSIQNREDAPLEIERLEALRPRQLRFVYYSELYAGRDANYWLPTAADFAERAGRSSSEDYVIGGAGTTGRNGFRSDLHHIDLFVSAPQPGRFSMRLTLRSRAAKPRARTIAIHNWLKPSTSSTKD